MSEIGNASTVGVFGYFDDDTIESGTSVGLFGWFIGGLAAGPDPVTIVSTISQVLNIESTIAQVLDIESTISGGG